MTKNAKKRDRNQEANDQGQRPLMLSEVIRQNLYAFIMEEGFKALGELRERDREELCGPAYRRGADDAPRRWGHIDGRLHHGWTVWQATRSERPGRFAGKGNYVGR